MLELLRDLLGEPELRDLLDRLRRDRLAEGAEAAARIHRLLAAERRHASAQAGGHGDAGFTDFDFFGDSDDHALGDTDLEGYDKCAPGRPDR